VSVQTEAGICDGPAVLQEWDGEHAGIGVAYRRGAILTRGNEPTAVSAESDTPHRAAMMQDMEPLAGMGVP
jgi:hypothetical protein